MSATLSREARASKPVTGDVRRVSVIGPGLRTEVYFEGEGGLRRALSNTSLSVLDGVSLPVQTQNVELPR